MGSEQYHDTESDLSLDFADIVKKQRESLKHEENKQSQEIESQVLITPAIKPLHN